MKPSRRSTGDASLLQRRYTSAPADADTSVEVLGDASLPAGADISLERRYSAVDASLGYRRDPFAPGVGYTSLAAAGDTSLVDRSDASPGSVADTDRCRHCAWCGGRIVASARVDAIFCKRKCRQAAFRIRRRRQIDQANDRPLRLCYADPPYPGTAFMYKDQPTYAGEVDHAELVASLEYSYDGFALSTSARALATVLPLFTREFRICAWVKPIGVSSATFGLHNAWEPLIVVPGRALRPGKRDWLAAQPARRGGSDLIGRKPEAFCVWLFDLLGMLPGDTLDDLFPGSGIVGRAWAEVCRQPSA